MATKKYPIGTQIRYKGRAKKDVGKKGKIVGYTGSSVWVVIPGSYLGEEVYQDSEHKWSTDIESLEILVIPNQQLLFAFMDENA